MKFMFAKERIMASLYELKDKNANVSEKPTGTENIGASVFYNYEEGKIKYDSFNSEHSKIEPQQQANSDLEYLNEPELMRMFNFADRTEYKTSGAFDIMITQNEKKTDDLYSDKYIKASFKMSMCF